ncbi:MAG: ATP-binding protein [Lentimicrobiaceae bacterium]
MKKTKTTVNIKWKIATGFLLLLILVFVSVLSVNKLATQLTLPDSGVSSSVTKLSITSNLLSNLIETDGKARAYISTGNIEYLKQYQQHELETRSLLDSLTLSSISNTNQYLRMLAVDSLLDLKHMILTEFIEARLQSSKNDTYNLGNIVHKYGDSIRVTNHTISKTITKQILTPPLEKQGLIKKLWKNITGKKKSDTLVKASPSVHVEYDTLLISKAVRDTTLGHVKSQLLKIEKREKISRQLAIEHEMMLIQADQDIMNEIRAVLLLFEKEEIARAIKGTENSRKVLDKLWITALVLAAIGLITALFFIVMIWKDLAKSAFYRKQLEQARSLAESLLKVKEQFLANMSHEIRTPLTSIIGFTERLSETKIDKEQASYLKYINSSSEHLLELINDLLDFTRINSGKLTLESKPFAPADLFEQAFDTLEPRAREKGLEMILQQNFPPYLFAGDPLRLRQIIYNLLSNSIKFTQQGKIVLQIKAKESEKDNLVNIIIRVADTGIGIPEEKQKMIFEEFTQVDHSITRKYGGSGLGLAICCKLVEMMYGTISVISKPDHGTIFTIKLALPIYKGDKSVVDTSSHVNKNSDLSKLTILLAEDDNTTRMLLNELLERYKAKVYQAEDGSSAFQIFKKHAEIFNLVITDVQMPGLSGPELLDRIKEWCLKQNIETPIVIGLTAHADSHEINGYKARGMDHIIIKPFKRADLLRVLNLVATSKLKNSTSDALNGSKTSDVTNNTEETKTKDSNVIVTAINDSKPESDLITSEKESKHRIGITSEDDDDIDITNFQKFAGNDQDALNQIIVSLTENITVTSKQMQDAFKEKNFMELSLLAHRIQPNIRSLGAKDIAYYLRNLEVICKEVPVKEEIVSQNLIKSVKHLQEIKEKLKNKITN